MLFHLSRFGVDLMDNCISAATLAQQSKGSSFFFHPQYTSCSGSFVVCVCVSCVFEAKILEFFLFVFPLSKEKGGGLYIMVC
jgi:hypothetical protein